MSAPWGDYKESILRLWLISEYLQRTKSCPTSTFNMSLLTEAQAETLIESNEKRLDDFNNKINKEGSLGRNGNQDNINRWLKESAPLARQTEALHNGERDMKKLTELLKA